MIHIAICDDNLPIVECIEQLVIHTSLKMEHEIEISIFYSGESFAKAIEDSCPFDLIFMDIEMQGISGIEAGKVLREDDENDGVQLVYVSSHESYHVQLFEAQPSGFIKKPIDSAAFELKLITSIQKILRKRKQRAPKLLPVQLKRNKLFIPIRNIIYLASDRRKIILQTLEERTEYYGTLSEEEHKLPSEQFIRIHQSFLVNFDFIHQICGKKMILTNGEELPISDKQSSLVKKCYLRIRGNLI